MGLGVTVVPIGLVSRKCCGPLRGGFDGATEFGVMIGLDRRRRCRGDAAPAFDGDVTETATFSSFLLSSKSSWSVD